MSDRVRKEIAIDLERLRHLLDVHRTLLVKCDASDPDSTEIAALAAVLHSFYTGIENVFRRIAIEIDADPPRGEFWHSALLDGMAQSSPARRAVISQELSDALQEYLDFRHVFRHAYSFELRWTRMKHLIVGCPKLLEHFEKEITGFLSAEHGRTADQ